MKDANAAIREIQANLRSRSEVIAERGYDAEAIDEEIAADLARAERLGIVRPLPAAPAKDDTDLPGDRNAA